jgi:hypothetical protein
MSDGDLMVHAPVVRLPNTLVSPEAMPTFADLTENFPDDKVPWLDRLDCDESKLTWEQLHWRRFGYLVLPGILPAGLIDAYMAHRAEMGIGLGGLENSVHGGTHASVLGLGCYKPLADKIAELLGEELGFNFTLTQFTSTERNWHQDDYLGGSEVWGHYCAVWMALGDIHPDSGPFEFIPGSHRWPGLRGERVLSYLPPGAGGWVGLGGQPGHWAQISESFTTPAIETEIALRGLPRQRFHGRTGDALIWHSKLMHRGSAPATPGMVRPAFIAHYYSVEQLAQGRSSPVRHEGGGLYVP